MALKRRDICSPPVLCIARERPQSTGSGDTPEVKYQARAEEGFANPCSLPQLDSSFSAVEKRHSHILELPGAARVRRCFTHTVYQGREAPIDISVYRCGIHLTKFRVGVSHPTYPCMPGAAACMGRDKAGHAACEWEEFGPCCTLQHCEGWRICSEM